MPFCTTLQYYRPTEPPPITGNSLAEFVAAFEGLKVAEGEGPLTIQVKFGEAIDQDDRPSNWEEPYYETISVTREIDWDLDVQCQSLRAVSNALAGHERPVYRTFLQLGKATKDISERLERSNSPENEVDLYLEHWYMEIGPILSCDLGSEAPFHVGWV